MSCFRKLSHSIWHCQYHIVSVMNGDTQLFCYADSSHTDCPAGGGDSDLQNLIRKLCVMSREAAGVLAGASKIPEDLDTIDIKSAPPLKDSVWQYILFLGDLGDRISAKASLDNLRSFDESRFSGSTLRPCVNQLTILFRKMMNRLLLGINFTSCPRA